MTPSSGLNAKDLCSEMNLGWHFYCDPKKQKEPGETQSTITPPTITPPTIAQAKQELKTIQDKLEDLKVLAVMHPTEVNVSQYMAFQQEQLERAALFSNTWKKTLWNTPELDYSVKMPISSVGNQLLSETKNQNRDEVMKGLNQRYGLFFFYTTGCGYCQKYSPILKAFSEHYGVEVMAVSMDGQVLPEWPNSQINQGRAEEFGLSGKPVPATILFDAKSKKLLPVGFGLLTVNELEERIYEIVSNESNGKESK